MSLIPTESSANKTETSSAPGPSQNVQDAEPTPSTSKDSSETDTSNSKWSAREEIRLLDAIEQFGFGNWQDISKHVESKGSTGTYKREISCTNCILRDRRYID